MKRIKTIMSWRAKNIAEEIIIPHPEINQSIYLK